MQIDNVKRLLNKTRHIIISSVFGAFFLFLTIFSLVPTDASINGHYYYYDSEGKVLEEIVLHINNTLEYYIYDVNNSAKQKAYDGQITKWRCVLNNSEYKEYSNKGLVCSPYQIQFCNNNWGSHFQMFKIDAKHLYSKQTIAENQQKCFIKK